METDAPNMLPPKELIEFPIPATGEVAPNNPANIRAIYEYFAGLRGIELGELVGVVEGNFRRLFGSGERGDDGPQIAPMGADGGSSERLSEWRDDLRAEI